MTLKLIILTIIGSVGYVAWAVCAWFDPSQRSGFLAMNVSMVTGTIGLALRDLPYVADPAPPVSPVVPQPLKE